MTYQILKLLHYSGLFMVIVSIGAFFVMSHSKDLSLKKLFLAVHGIGLIIMFMAGFGILKYMGYGFPPWVHIKLTIWLILGFIPTLILRLPKWKNATLVLTLLLFLGAAAAALLKPS